MVSAHPVPRDQFQARYLAAAVVRQHLGDRGSCLTAPRRRRVPCRTGLKMFNNRRPGCADRIDSPRRWQSWLPPSSPDILTLTATRRDHRWFLSSPLRRSARSHRCGRDRHADHFLVDQFRRDSLRLGASADLLVALPAHRYLLTGRVYKHRDFTHSGEDGTRGQTARPRRTGVFTRGRRAV